MCRLACGSKELRAEGPPSLQRMVQQIELGNQPRTSPIARYYSVCGSMGSVMVNSVPRPGSLSTVMLPLCFWMML